MKRIILRRAEDVKCAVEVNGAILVKEEENYFISLDQVDTTIWQMTIGGDDPDEIIDFITMTGIGERVEIEARVKTRLDDWRCRGFLVGRSE